MTLSAEALAAKRSTRALGSEPRRDRPHLGTPLAKYDRKDHYHQRAKREGYRSRAAYKLAEIQQAHRLIRRGNRVVDLGCWPGGWLPHRFGLMFRSGLLFMSLMK